MENWITISRYEQSHDAHMVKSYLESQGISVFLKDEITSQVTTCYGSAIGGIKLQIPEEQYDKAYELLENGGYVKPRLFEEKIKLELIENKTNYRKGECPFCRSMNIVRVKQSDPITNIILSILGVFFPTLRDPNKCNSCQRIWKFIS